jgi:hypothetical protein
LLPGHAERRQHLRDLRPESERDGRGAGVHQQSAHRRESPGVGVRQHLRCEYRGNSGYRGDGYFVSRDATGAAPQLATRPEEGRSGVTVHSRLGRCVVVGGAPVGAGFASRPRDTSQVFWQGSGLGAHEALPEGSASGAQMKLTCTTFFIKFVYKDKSRLLYFDDLTRFNRFIRKNSYTIFIFRFLQTIVMSTPGLTVHSVVQKSN